MRSINEVINWISSFYHAHTQAVILGAIIIVVVGFLGNMGQRMQHRSAVQRRLKERKALQAANEQK